MMRLLFALSVVISTLNAASGVPYDYQRYFRALTCPLSGANTAYVTITLPVVAQGGLQNEQFPTVLFLNGFVLRSCVYAPYANALAARGYAVIQFDDAKNPRSDFEVLGGGGGGGVGGTVVGGGHFLYHRCALHFYVSINSTALVHTDSTCSRMSTLMDVNVDGCQW